MVRFDCTEEANHHVCAYYIPGNLLGASHMQIPSIFVIVLRGNFLLKKKQDGGFFHLKTLLEETISEITALS